MSSIAGSVMIVLSLVLGSIGIVYVINAVRERKRKHVAVMTACFFGSLVTALIAAYMFHKIPHSKYSYADYVWSMPSHGNDVHVDEATIVAMGSGAGGIMA